MKRRDFLRLIGVLSGTTFMSSCGSADRSKKLISYILPPEELVIPGEAYYHPSTCTECPAGCGILVKSRERWPVKLEGIPGHPINDGGLCIRGQSSLTRLYHPERLKNPMVRNSGGKFKDVSWEKALSLVAESLGDTGGRGPKNVYLAGRTTGQLARFIDVFCEKLKVERLPEFEAYSHSAVKEANRVLFGEKEVPRYLIEEADFLLTVGAAIIETFVSTVSFARQLSVARKKDGFQWYHVEPHLSLTGANAHKRFVTNPGREQYLLSFLLWDLLVRREPENRMPAEIREAIPRVSSAVASGETGIMESDLRDIAIRFRRAKRPLVIAGGVSTAHGEGLETAVLTGLIQWMTGATGVTVDFARNENYASVGSFRDMEELSRELGRGEVGVMFISRTNPVFALPPDYTFRENLKKAKLTVGIGDFFDETMTEVDVILPLSHSIESWGDAEPRKGVRSLIKPAVRPLEGTLPEGEILIQILRGSNSESAGPMSFKEYLFEEWGNRYGEEGTKELLIRGHVVDDVADKKISLNTGTVVSALSRVKNGFVGGKPVLVLSPSIRTFDGRSRNLPLLSEIPDPLTTISYGSWLSVSEGSAKNIGVRERDEVTVSASGWSVSLPVTLQPGLADGIFVMGRDAAGSAPLVTEESSGELIRYLDGIDIVRTGKRIPLPILSGSLSQHGRGIIPDPAHKDEHRHERITLYPDHAHDTYRWTMAIDLDACIGCAACVAACYIENNVPIVGKRDHLKGREMSWLRIEPFYDKEGKAEFIPMLCQQCHSAPCETVCPVYAAYHNNEGLNVQVYNRCVGTRYCANNCPYKVRRFNWFKYRWKKPLNRMLNPEILTRGAGVMEKCTFCIQRIRSAKDTAKDESRTVREKDVVTACAQSCPTGAIAFGNLLDKESKIYRLAHSERAYRVFESLGTEPSVYYLSGEKTWKRDEKYGIHG
jgi:molybdopterin-containing oxidoreductase family iron-sulfur binding subunit